MTTNILRDSRQRFNASNTIMSVGVGRRRSKPSVCLSVCLFVRLLFVCLFVCLQYNSKTNNPKVFLVQGMIFGYSRSDVVLESKSQKVKVTGSMTLHNDTSFQTITALHSHSLGGDTGTITLQPRFIVTCQSLGGDTDKRIWHGFELYEYILVFVCDSAFDMCVCA